MKKNILLTLSILVLLELLSMIQAQITLKLYKYCIVGSGPGGLQMAYFLKKANRKYIVFEKNKISGSFFTHYPRHRQLLSVNKKFTGAKNAEFNLRHDWNSLLSDNASLIMPNYSDKYYPHADELVRYLNDYANQFKLNIQYDTNIVRISRVHYKKKIKFKMMDQRNTLTLCDVAIVSTGLSVPYIPPNITGIDLTEGYESISTNASDYEGQSVLILGQGNSAFETAQAISSTCNFLHMHGRGGVRLATSTHYIGDVRAVNSKVIDSYQLKTLDGLNEQDIRKMGFVKTPDNRIKDCPKTSKGDLEDDIRNSGYDRVIRCLGFQVLLKI
ncbi:uncharacterized protein TRIADDRAFT_60515 [Trichoplax adhaerens]|uniref:FAD/NAD(P)-binding domain-containing protein n=1 Tax=Trichoplax adhaerens TaxID=10228 RepID=B3S8E9_TRIAD|nr:hypothetical protein TRIADDRAFT_60515 [Trichoplax adhaerens]EDV20871.1 hypothetical protein TRIADDRAFT_60515 [Trichoplax adhaerens]|eukprot:XP_002116515.1 hypothetical protein TRIADDRAFT_60515 [Trichoplax adhaerens]